VLLEGQIASSIDKLAESVEKSNARIVSPRRLEHNDGACGEPQITLMCTSCSDSDNPTQWSIQYLASYCKRPVDRPSTALCTQPLHSVNTSFSQHSMQPLNCAPLAAGAQNSVHSLAAHQDCIIVAASALCTSSQTHGTAILVCIARHGRHHETHLSTPIRS
jgi:hypothetical protein